MWRSPPAKFIGQTRNLRGVVREPLHFRIEVSDESDRSILEMDTTFVATQVGCGSEVF